MRSTVTSRASSTGRRRRSADRLSAKSSESSFMAFTPITRPMRFTDSSREADAVSTDT